MNEWITIDYERKFKTSADEKPKFVRKLFDKDKFLTELKRPDDKLFGFVQSFFGKDKECDEETDWIIRAVAIEIFKDKIFKELTKKEPQLTKEITDKWVG